MLFQTMFNEVEWSQQDKTPSHKSQVFRSHMQGLAPFALNISLHWHARKQNTLTN